MAAGTAPTAEGHTAPAINGQTVCTEAERQSRFPAKRHSEPDGLHRRVLRLCQAFSRRSCACSQAPFLFLWFQFSIRRGKTQAPV